MPIKLPVRNYFTFQELMKRWECSENDLRHAVIAAKIRPAIRLIGEHYSLNWEQDPSGDWMASEYFPGEYGYRLLMRPASWLYLQDPYQIGAFDCEFRLVCDGFNPEKMDVPIDYWFALPVPMKMDEVVSKGVFLLKDIARYESENSEEKSVGKADQEITTKERNSLLVIIAVLAKEAKLDRAMASRSASQIQQMAALMGISIGESTIENHLKKIDQVLESRFK